MAEASSGKGDASPSLFDISENGSGIVTMNYLVEYICKNYTSNFHRYLMGFLGKIESKSVLEKIRQEYCSYEVDIKNSKINVFSKQKGFPVRACVVRIDGENANHVILLINFQENTVYVLDPKNHYYLNSCENARSAIKKHLPMFEVRVVGLKGESDSDYLLGDLNPLLNPSHLVVILLWGYKTFYDNKYLWHRWVREIIMYPEFDKEKGNNILSNFELFNGKFPHINVENEADLVVDIVDEAVRSETPLDMVMAQIEARYEDELSVRERSFVENKYVENCMTVFIREAELHLTQNIEEISKDLNSFLDGFQGETEIPKCFGKIKYFSLLDNIQSGWTYVQRQHFIATLKRKCFTVLECRIRTLNAEIDFVIETKCTLRDLFVGVSSENSEEISERRRELVESFNKSDLNLSVRDYIQYLKQSSCPEFEKLRGKALALGGEGEFVLLPRELARLFSQFNATIVMETEFDINGKVLIFHGSFIKIQDVRDKLDQIGVYEVRIVATQIINIDIDLHLPGINLVLVSPQVFVSGERMLDLSGVDGEELKVRKASDGKESGDHGSAGETGNSGIAGGNAFVYTKLITNDNNLTIKTHGGNGQKGQDGGNGETGADGKDGYEMSQSEFDENYPKCTTFWGYLRYQAAVDFFFASPAGLICEIYGVKYLDGRYYEIKTKEGCRVIYSAYSDHWIKSFLMLFGYPRLQGYCIHYGGPGTDGGQGGMGGRGGDGGCGGIAGTVRITCEEHNVNIDLENGREGERGKDGRGGIGGYNGRRGLDIARVEPSQIRSVRSYGLAKLDLQYVSNDSADAAYCPHESKLRNSSRYATIKVLSKSKEGKTRAHGERTEKNGVRINTARDERLHERSVPISTNSVVNTYRHVVDTEVHDVLEIRDTSSLKIGNIHESSKTYMRATSTHELTNLSSGHVALRTKSIKKAMEDKNEFTTGESTSCIMKMIDKIETMAKELRSETDAKLRQVIDLVTVIEKSLTENPVDIQETLPGLLASLSKIRTDQTYYQQFSMWMKGQNELRKILNYQLDKLQVISLKKYKFARLGMFAMDVVKLEAVHYNLSENTCRGRMMSIIKTRLIHSHYETVEGLWSLQRKEEVCEFLETCVQNINRDFSHVCSTLNSFERRTKNQAAEEKTDSEEDSNDEEDEEKETAIQEDCNDREECATHDEDINEREQTKGSYDEEESCEIHKYRGVRNAVPEIRPSGQETENKAPRIDYFRQNIEKIALESHFVSQSVENPIAESTGFNQQTDKQPLTFQHFECPGQTTDKSFNIERPKSFYETSDGRYTDDESSGGMEMADKIQKEQRERNYKIIKKFEDIIKHKEDQRYLEAVDSLKMLQYVESRQIELLVDILTTKIVVDGFHLSSDLFIWFISRILAQTDSQSVKIFVWIISTTLMENWLAEYMVLQLIYQEQVAIVHEDTMRQHLYMVKDRRWLPALWESLWDDDVTFSDDDRLAQLFSAFAQLREEPYEDDLMRRLADTDPSQWSETLLDYNSYRCLLELPVEWTEDETIEADAYLDELRKHHGDNIVDRLLKRFKKSKNLTPKKVIDVLRNFYHEVWPFTSGTLEKIEHEPVETWEASLSGMGSSVTERSIKDLIELMKGDGNNSLSLVSNEHDVFGNSKGFDVEHVLEQSTSNEGKIAKTFGDEFSNDWVNEFEEKIKQMNESQKDYHKGLVRKWADEFRAKVKLLSVKEKEEFLLNNITEVFGHVEVGLSLVCGFKLRQAQRLAAILLVKTNYPGLLEQVATGEGKTIIIVLFCIIKNLIGHCVDVITSSPVLAERDFAQNAGAFELFGVSVSINCSENMETRAEAYKKDIVYGEIGSFQRDVLLQRFYNKNTRGKRGFDTIVVDEVDSMLLDKAENVLYLSHDISDLDALEPVFVYIWSLVHGKGLVGTDEDIMLVQAAMMSAMYGTIRKEDLEEQLSSLPEIKSISDSILQQLHDVKMLDEKGSITRRSPELKNNQIELGLNEKLKLDTDFDTDGAVLSFLKDVSRQGIQIVVPNYLEQFIDLHLTDWITSAFSARFMQEKRHYLIDIDRSDIESGESANVVIVDVDTGVEQFNMQWSDGLHQFLQLKHGCRISVESLKAVFISNVTFFKLYEGSVYGLTGTLGSRQERELLKSLYKIDYVNIPTFRPKMFVHHEGLLYDSEEDWIEKSVEIAVSVAEQRPVLMVCETIRDLEKFHRKFLTVKKSTDVELYVYKNSYEILDIVQNGREIEKGCVILATNLAGRGTDIKISDGMDDKGGLHVILTYMPRNTRIREQAFGRAARKGQKGSGQLCIMNTNDDIKDQNALVAILTLTKERNAEEKQRLKLIIEHYESFIKKEEGYFEKFQEMYSQIKSTLKQVEVSEQEIILHACLDRWAFWLDSLGKILVKKDHDTEAHWNEFKTRMNNEVNSSRAAMTINSPSLRVKLAKALIESKKYSEAMEIFQKVIADEPNFSESAHYYYGHCVVKSTGLASYDDKLLLTLHLLKAEEGFKKKIEIFSELNNIVASIKTLYGKDIEHFVMNDAYERQKGDLINIISVYCDSVRNVLGHGVDVSSLKNVSQDIALVSRIIENEVLFQAPTFNDLSANAEKQKENTAKFMEEQMTKLFQRYELYSHELAARISLLREQSRGISEEDFRNILPSREEFWSQLKRSNLLCDEKEYIIIDKEKVESSGLDQNYFQQNMSMLNELSSDDFKNLFPYISDVALEEEAVMEDDHCEKSNTILISMFPEYTEDIIKGNYIAIPSKNHGFLNEEFCKILKTCGAIYPNTIAYLKKDEARACKLDKYDGITEHELFEIDGVNDTIAKEIFFQLCESGVLKSEMSNIHEVELPKHKRFETEVKNLLRKYYFYRILLLKTVDDGALPFEQLTPNPNRLIWNDLTELNIITPMLVRESIDEEQAQIILDHEQSEMKEAWNSIGYFFGWRKVTSVATAIYDWKPGLFKYESIDSCLKDINDMLDDKTKRNASVELVLLSNKGFDHILTLQEEKWTWTTICKIVGIVILGLAQIALGVIIEVFSLGLGTFVAAGLMEEGVGDIMFAIECAFSGHCTLKEYLKYKVVSVMFTVLTAGVGAFFARGAQFSRFGYKIAAEHLMEKTGRELIKETGKRRLAKECAKLAGKKMAKGAAMGAATNCIDMAVECLLRDHLKEMCNDVLSAFKNTETNKEMYQRIDELCKKVGSNRARVIVQKIGADFLKSEESELVSGAIKVFDAVGNGMQDALKRLGKLQKTGNARTKLLANIASSLTQLAEYAPYIRAVNEIKDTCRTYNDVIPKQLKEKLDETDVSANENDEYNQRESSVILVKLQEDLTNHVEEILTNKLLKPLLQHQTNKLVRSVGKSVRTNYRNCQTYKQRKSFDSLKRSATTQSQKDLGGKLDDDKSGGSLKINILSDYHSSLVQLQRKVRSPDLYADILCQGVPMGIHETQAICNLVGRPIHVVVCGGDGRKTLPEEFKPSSPLELGKPPLVVYFLANADNSVGHFSDSPDFESGVGGSKSSGKNNCLLDTVSKMVGTQISREGVARIVQNDPNTRDRIQRGIHRHFTEIGGIGGARRLLKARESMKIRVKVLLTKTQQELKAMAKSAYRDRAKFAGSYALGKKVYKYNTGNHEAFGIEHIPEWTMRTHQCMQQGIKTPFTWLDLHSYIRFDTRYAVFDYGPSGYSSLQGHPGAVFAKPDDRPGSQRTKGSTDVLHEQVTKKILKCGTPQEAARVALQAHLNATASRAALQKKEKEAKGYFKSTFTATGHDLSKLKHREVFLKGLDRERFKMKAVLVRLKHMEKIKSKYPSPGQDQFCKDLLKHVKKITAMEDIGDVLMDPAPCQ